MRTMNNNYLIPAFIRTGELQMNMENVINYLEEIVKTIDISKYQHSHREYCEIVESIFQEIFNRDGEKGNDKS